MLITAHQPNLLPRAKVLQKLSMSDIWVVLDDVQFNARDYQHRAFIIPDATSQRPHWLSVPVSRPNGRRTVIRDVAPASGADVVRTLVNGLQGSFRRGSALDELLQVLATAYDKTDLLVSFATATTMFLLESCGLPSPSVVRASDLRANALAKTQGIVQLLNTLGETSYLADSGASTYLDAAAMRDAGIDVRWQLWKVAPMTNLSGEMVRNSAAVNVWLRSQGELARLLADGRTAVTLSGVSA